MINQQSMIGNVIQAAATDIAAAFTFDI